MATGPQAGGSSENRAANAGGQSVAVALLAGVLVVALGLATAAYFLFRNVNIVAGLPRLVPDFRSAKINIPARDGSLSSQSVRPSYTLDLESGAVGAGTMSDLWWHFSTRTDRSLDARNGASIALIEGRDFDGSDADFLSSLSYTVVSLSASGDGAQVKPGALFAVRTAEGNYARVRIVSAGGAGDELKLEWVLFRSAGGGGARPRGDPAAWKSKLAAGLAAYRNKRPEEAERLYAEALADAEKFGPNNPRVGLVLSRSGSLYWSMRKLDRAEWYLRRAAEIIDPLTQGEIVGQLGGEQVFLAEQTQRMLGLIYRDQRKDADAARHFEQAAAAARALTGVREDTRGAAVASDLYELAMAQCNLGRLDEAGDSLKQAAQANPQNPSAAHRLKAIERLEGNMAQGRPCRR